MGSGLTDVGGYSRLKSHCLRNVGTCHEYVLTPLGEVLGDEVEVVEQTEFHSVIGLVGVFPSDSLVRIAGHIDAFVVDLPAIAEERLISGTIHIHFREVVETVLFITDLVVSDETVRYPEFKVVNRFLQRLEPRLV